MSAVVNVSIHPSQFPEAIRRDRLESLRTRRVNHKFHYDSVKQAQKWLDLHHAYSPFRTDPDVSRIYGESCAAIAETLSGDCVHFVSLGCGDGRKDLLVLEAIRRSGRQVLYTPCDVSPALVLLARETALVSAAVTADRCFPLVCDLANAGDLPSIFRERGAGADQTIFTFFGMIPNFEPEYILARLAGLVGPLDRLLFSANLLPAGDLHAGMRRILPLYDNDLTRDWLMCFLTDVGVETADGHIEFLIEPAPGYPQIGRVVAYFCFEVDRTIACDSEQFSFLEGDRIRLFFSCRYEPAQICSLLAEHGLWVASQWVAASGEEGVFLAQRESR